MKVTIEFDDGRKAEASDLLDLVVLGITKNPETGQRSLVRHVWIDGPDRDGLIGRLYATMELVRSYRFEGDGNGDATVE